MEPVNEDAHRNVDGSVDYLATSEKARVRDVGSVATRVVVVGNSGGEAPGMEVRWRRAGPAGKGCGSR